MKASFVCLLFLLLLSTCINSSPDSENAVRASLEIFSNTNLIYKTYITVQPDEINEVRFTFNHPAGVYDLIISAQDRYPDKKADFNVKRGENILEDWIDLIPLSAEVESTHFIVTLKDSLFVNTFKKDALEFKRVERACKDEQLRECHPEFRLDYFVYIYPNQTLSPAINYFIYKSYIKRASPMTIDHPLIIDYPH